MKDEDEDEVVLICLPLAAGVYFADNIKGECDTCGCAIAWRPHAPARRRICLPCAQKDFLDSGRPVEIRVTAESRAEIRAFIGAAGPRDPGTRH